VSHSEGHVQGEERLEPGYDLRERALGLFLPAVRALLEYKGWCMGESWVIGACVLKWL
jgi:hypothetical protein